MDGIPEKKEAKSDTLYSLETNLRGANEECAAKSGGRGVGHIYEQSS